MIEDADARKSRLPHVLAILYAAAIAYASLQPFGDWMQPLDDTPFWALAPWPVHGTRFDLIANVLAYVPLGFFVALVPRRATAIGAMVFALLAGATLSFTLETLQWFMPPRFANIADLAANSAGALAGGLLGAAYTRSPLRGALRGARNRQVLPGTIGDIGLALLATWLVAQMNPAIAPFSTTFDPGPAIAPAIRATAGDDLAATLIEAAQSAFQLLGVGLFVALLVRDRRFAGGAALLLVGAALLIKGVAAWLLLKPQVFATWLAPAALLGIAAGAVLLLPANRLPRPAQVTVCAIALLSSLLTPLLAPDLMFAAPPLTLFSWRYGHLLNFNGLTRIVLVLWPLAAAVWLFLLAGRPGWGHADLAQPPAHPSARPPDPL